MPLELKQIKAGKFQGQWRWEWRGKRGQLMAAGAPGSKRLAMTGLDAMEAISERVGNAALGDKAWRRRRRR